MKKSRLIGALLACTMAVSGIPTVIAPDTALTVTADAATAKLAAPKNIKGTLDGTTLTLTWSAVSGADAYRVYKYNDSTGKYETLKNTASTKCVIKGLTKGNYKFRVAALVKSGNKYSAQTKSTAIKATVKGTTTEKKTTAADPITFPAFGTAKDKAIKAMDLSNGFDMGEMQKGLYSYAGFKKINNEDCMVMLFFNSDGKFCYGGAIITPAAMSVADLNKALTAANGKETITMNSSGASISAWVFKSSKTFKMVLGNDDGAIYASVSLDLVPSTVLSDEQKKAILNGVGDFGSILT